MKLYHCPFLAVLISFFPLSPGTPSTGAQTDVEVPLIHALEQTGKARAIIVLFPVEDLRALDRVKSEMLAEIPAGTFRLGYRYENLPLLSGEVTATSVRALMLSGRVKRIGVDERVHAVLSESAPIVGAPAVHTLGFTGKGVTVAVLDSGIDTDHQDLSDNIASGAWHFLGGGTNTGAGAEDDYGHGTEVAGTITSRGIVAPPGIAPDADILAIKVLDQNGSGWTSDQVSAINHVVLNRATWANLAAINISIGTNTTYYTCPCDQSTATTQALATAINAAKAAGIPVFAAAGNGAHTNAMPAPACIGNAISVGATYDKNYTSVVWTSCTDSGISQDQIVCITDRMAGGCLDLLAPGALLDLPAMGGGKSMGVGGTSFACPHAAAAAALLRQAIPGMAPTALEAALKTSGQPIYDAALSVHHPRLDILAALNNLPRIEVLDSCRIGWRVRHRLKAPTSLGLTYTAAASLSTRPKLPVGGGKSIALTVDDLMLASFLLPSIFEGFTGVLNSRGEQIIFLNVPNNGQLVGITFYLGFLTYTTVVQEVSWPLKQVILS